MLIHLGLWSVKELADSAGSVESSMVKADKHLKHMRACLQTGKIAAEMTERAMVAGPCPAASTSKWSWPATLCGRAFSELFA